MSSWVVPAGGIGSANFTNTGLGYDGTNLLIGDFTNGRIVVATKAGAYVSEIVLASAPAGSVQGVAYDTSDGSYWVGHYAATNGTIRRYNSSGTLLQTITTTVGNDGPNGVAYDAANDRILACWTNGVVRGYDCATGTLAETITLSGFQGTRCDGITLDATTPSTKLWVSSEGTEFGPAFVQQAVRSTGVCSGAFGVPTSIEGFQFLDGYLYTCNDQGFHLNATNGNRVWRLNPTTGDATTGVASVVASGSFDLRVSTGKQEVSGLGFQPKLVIFFGALSTAGVTSLEHFGTLDSKGNQWAESTRQNDALNPSRCARAFDATYCIAYCATSDGVSAGLQITAEGACTHDGFALNVTTDTSARRLHWVAVGGDLVSAKAGKFDLTTSAGTQAVTGVGFQPSAVLFAGNTSSTSEGAFATESRFVVGAMTASAQWVMSLFSLGNSSPTASAGVALTSAVFARSGGSGGALTGVASRSSLDSDGFTLNKTTPTGVNVRLGYLAIGGAIPVAAGTFDQPTSTGNQSITGVGFQPRALLFASSGRTTSTTVTAGSRSMIGAALSSSNRRAYAATSENAVTTSNTARDVSETHCLIACSDGGTPTRLAAADFVSQDSDGFTVNWTTADATARQNFYLAFGEAVPTSLGPGDKFLKLKLLGYSGSINDMLFNYYRDRGATANNLNEAEMQFLAAQGALATPLNNRRRQFYSSLGYTGSINDMEYQYWWNL